MSAGPDIQQRVRHYYLMRILTVHDRVIQQAVSRSLPITQMTMCHEHMGCVNNPV